MFKKLLSWLRNDARFEALQQDLSKQQETMAFYVDALEAGRKEAADLKAQLAERDAKLASVKSEQEEREARYASTEPWIEIRSAEFNELKGVQIELDWNEAFIEHLKSHGITGRDEETIVQKWLAFLYDDISKKLERVAANSTAPIRDYE